MSKINSFLKNWEYWPSWAFYLPNVPYAFYLALRAKSLVFFSTANPAIKGSGNGLESKFDTLTIVPKRYRPKSVLILPKTSIDKVEQLIQKENINFPLIAKPDIGFRGLLVKKINSLPELKQYLASYPINIIIQEFIEYENECGIFYYRKPNEKKGTISSLTLKKFLSVTGDGVSTLKQLVLNDKRTMRYLNVIEEQHQNKMEYVLNKNEVIKLSVIGNHAKGTQFINGNNLISKKLHQTFDKLSHEIEGWYYGRIDLKYNSFEMLENGSDFKILEINGIIAEPTHMYDASKYSFKQALKSIREHWKILCDISIINHTQKNIPYQKTSAFIKEMIDIIRYISKVESFLTKKF